MSKNKSPDKKESQPEKGEIAATRKKRQPQPLAPYRPLDVWRDFDRVFERFRTDFKSLLWPLEAPLMRPFPTFPSVETRTPIVDLEDRGKDFLLTAEMPGFTKEDVDIQVTDDAVEIKGSVGWKYDEKTKRYICKERACESFYRMIELPEQVKAGAAKANMKEGVLEIVLPKKAPKQKKKVAIE